jgi:hypothetical protein
MRKIGLCIALIPLACTSHDPCDEPFKEMGQCLAQNFEGTRRAGPGFETSIGGVSLSAGAINGTLSAGEINGTLSAGAINGTLGAGEINGSLGGAPGGVGGGGGGGGDVNALCNGLCSGFTTCTVKPALKEFFNRDEAHAQCVNGCIETQSEHPQCFTAAQAAAAMCSSVMQCGEFGECITNAAEDADCD